MAQEWLTSTLPAAGTIAAAVVSVAAAIGTAVLAYSRSALLERQKNEYQRELALLKTQLQQGLEDRKLGLQKELEEFKSGLSDEAAARNARRGYEYDARKRLYQELEPLLFQLFEAAEGALFAVVSLVRAQNQGHLPEYLKPEEHQYYIRSIVHRLFCPLVFFRLLQRSTTSVDLSLDRTIRLRYALLKACYLTWTDDFDLKDLVPVREYEPNDVDWDSLRRKEPAIYWRQGLVIGDLDSLTDSMIVVDGNIRRVMNFGEFNRAVERNKDFREVFEFARDIFESFDFEKRPVLGRLLLSYACLMHVLTLAYPDGATAEDIDLRAALSYYLQSNASDGLRCRVANGFVSLQIVEPYVLKRLDQAIQGGYAKF